MAKVKTLRQEIGPRAHYVKLRLSDVELAHLKKECLKHKLMMAEYIRRVVFEEMP